MDGAGSGATRPGTGRDTAPAGGRGGTSVLAAYGDGGSGRSTLLGRVLDHLVVEVDVVADAGVADGARVILHPYSQPPASAVQVGWSGGGGQPG